jgi:hypothetical protein
MSRRPSPTLIVAFLALLVSVSGVAFGTIPARDGDIHLCYSKKTGDVQLVDTQRDRFACEQNWRGAIVDTTPTSLVSPDRRFKVEATNSGARLTGPDGTVEVTADNVRIVSADPVQVTSGQTLALRGRRATIDTDLDVVVTAKDIRLLASGLVDIFASGVVHIKGSQVQTESGQPQN